MSIYDFKVLDMNGQERNLSEYRGKVLLIVNTATEFLVDKNGQVVARFEPVDDISEVEKSIVDCL